MIARNKGGIGEGVTIINKRIIVQKRKKKKRKYNKNNANKR